MSPSNGLAVNRGWPGIELEKTYSSMQAEVDAKTKKLRKLFQKLQSTKQDIIDVTEEYNRDRRDLEETQQELLKELKLKYLIIENFIPPTEKEKLLSRAQYDEESDSWFMAAPGRTASNTISKRPVSAAGSRRPVSEYARVVGSIAAPPHPRILPLATVPTLHQRQREHGHQQHQVHVQCQILKNIYLSHT